MDNKQELLDEYQRQLQELTEKINALSAEAKEPTPVQPKTPPVQAPVCQPAPTAAPAQPQYKPANVAAPQPRDQKIPSWITDYARPAQPQQTAAPTYQPPKSTPPVQENTTTPNKNMEGVIGRNLFAILASLLILVGISIFISTIYEYIPTAVKVLAIYAFGFAMLGVGAALYARNKNNFWLGVASCGLAELLVCVIASYSYFDILSLSVTFVMILLWILCSFWLTKIHPVVFKTIGYMGFTISLWFAFFHLVVNDLPLYFGFLVFYFALGCFFLLTNRHCKKTNTVIAFVNVLHLSMFVGITDFLPDELAWLGIVIGFAILAAYHVIYIFGSKLAKNAYPFFAMLSSLVLSLLTIGQEIYLTVPILMIALFTQWLISFKIKVLKEIRWCYTIFSVLYLWILCMVLHFCDADVWYWFAAAVAAAYLLCYLTQKRDVAWLGLGCFICLYTLVSSELGIGIAATFLAALAIFVLTNSKLLRRDNILQIAWYAMVLVSFNNLYLQLIHSIPDSYVELYQLDNILDGLYGLAHAVINTAYLHLCLSKRPDASKLTLKSILVMVIQGIILLGCMGMVSSKNWIEALLGVVSSLLIISYSLHHVYITNAESKELLVWQFIKFSLYCFIVPTMMNSPSILVHILLLVIAILAIIVGFRLDRKVVRTYGLVLSLVDVATLVFFNIDYSDSLQFSLGIVLCGLLCFAISFIYSKIAKSATDENSSQKSVEDSTAE